MPLCLIFFESKCSQKHNTKSADKNGSTQIPVQEGDGHPDQHFGYKSAIQANHGPIHKVEVQAQRLGIFANHDGDHACQQSGQAQQGKTVKNAKAPPEVINAESRDID